MSPALERLESTLRQLLPTANEAIPPHMVNRTLQDVLLERVDQEEKWGTQNHDPFTYLAILQEEVGEFSKEALEEWSSGVVSPNMRTEAVQVAAVALAIVECLDRNEWSWPKTKEEVEA